MTGLQIRRYQEEDEESVKEIFALGMSEYVPSAFMHFLRLPLTQMVLMIVFCALLTSSKSFLLPVLTVTLLLAGARQLVTYLTTSYIDTCLRTDLSHIRETYLEKKGTCFWVAELEGRVVAMVACLPLETQSDCLELKRMSVRRTHRGMGVAKALCRTVGQFAQERGYRAVVLYTSVLQTDAQKLYEHLGYQRTSESTAPGLPAKLANFTLFEYRLEIRPDGDGI